MAATAGSVLYLKFGTSYGEKTFSYKYANTEVSAATVKNLMNTMITNGSVFRFPPLTIVSANIAVTNVTEFDLSQG